MEVYIIYYSYFVKYTHIGHYSSLTVTQISMLFIYPYTCIRPMLSYLLYEELTLLNLVSKLSKLTHKEK
jgi:hypothetical protein